MSKFAVNGKTPVAAWVPSRDDAGNGTTTLNDLVGSSNGTLTNMDPATDWAIDAGASGIRALDFDGTNDFVDFGDSLDSVWVGASAKFTISAWAKPESTGILQIITKNGDTNTGENQRQWFLRLSSLDIEFAWFGTLTAAAFRIVRSANKASQSQWNHVVVTYDASIANADNKAELYLNGSLQSRTIPFTAGSPTSIQNGTAKLAMGAFVGTAGTSQIQPFLGRLDDFRVFDQLLNSSDVSFLYNNGNGRGRVTGRRRNNALIGLL